MKYIITESQVKNMMWNYLNSVDYDILGGEPVGEIIMLRKGTKDYHDYIYKTDDRVLFVETDIVTGFSGLFNIDEEESLNYIGDWFEDKYGVEVNEIINWT
jgi:hypothetical protein